MIQRMVVRSTSEVFWSICRINILWDLIRRFDARTMLSCVGTSLLSSYAVLEAGGWNWSECSCFVIVFLICKWIMVETMYFFQICRSKSHFDIFFLPIIASQKYSFKENNNKNIVFRKMNIFKTFKDTDNLTPNRTNVPCYFCLSFDSI